MGTKEELFPEGRTFLNQCDNIRKSGKKLNLPEIREAFTTTCHMHRDRVDDIRNILVMMSSEASDWLERRTVFTTSLAVTSMAGYILGLGDRHTENIMMKNEMCKLVHIDYGDCFEVCQKRPNFPEKVPFRLTRLFVRALDVAGTDGTFSQCCRDVMTVIRSQREQITGLLKAFEDDPLIQHEAGTDSHFRTDIMARIQAKLQGKDFDEHIVLSVGNQVQKLIEQATNVENLAQMFAGWAPFL